MAIIDTSKYWNPEASLEYNNFIADLKSNRLEHWANIIQNTGCKVMIGLPENIWAGQDAEYAIWCKENCNERYFVYNENYVFFETEEDALAFKLRWT